MKHLKKISEMFQIGNPIQSYNPTNCYKLVINNMSGDGDHYEKTETFIGKEYESLIEDIIELCNLSERTFGRNQIKERWEEIKSKHSKFFTEEIDDSYEPIITYDVTNPSSVMDTPICKPFFKKLTWFDDKGIEHDVDIK